MPSPAAELATRLGLRFDDLSLLEQALVHSSFINERPDLAAASNERLEFLGDAVISLVISEALFARHPDEHEGLLTTRRAAIVSARGLSRLATRIGLSGALVMGTGAERSGTRARGSVLAGVFEAVCGAIHLDQGLDVTRAWLLRVAAPELDAPAPASTLKPAKSRLQEYCFARSGRPPLYRVLSVEGPDHGRTYVVEVVVEGRPVGTGRGRNKRDAETEAATAALALLDAEGGA
jgi:ribonuclease III